METAPIKTKSPVSDMLNMAQACVRARKGRAYVRGLIDSGKLQAYKVGGTAESPRLRVKIEDLDAAVEEDQLYIPPRVSARSKKKTALHPAIAQWQEDPAGS